MEQSKHLPRQMTGPVVNALMAAQSDELADSRAVCGYLHGLSIRTAQETELENIGRLVGYPRPLVPEGFEQENIFLFTEFLENAPNEGFSEVGSEVGGRLTSTGASPSNYMSLGLYRKFLDKVAYIKRYGLTIYAVDSIARLISSRYEIGWDEAGDITLSFGEFIGYKNMWVLSSLFRRVATAPQVIISTAEAEEEES